MRKNEFFPNSLALFCLTAFPEQVVGEQESIADKLSHRPVASGCALWPFDSPPLLAVQRLSPIKLEKAKPDTLDTTPGKTGKSDGSDKSTKRWR